MAALKPQREILTIWRILLVMAALPVAFLTSLIFAVWGFVWWVITAIWALLFLGMYLFYLPTRYRRLSFRITREQLILHSGALYRNLRTLPLENIQFTSLLISPLDRVFGLATLEVVAPGGKLVIHGLRRKDAQALAEVVVERPQGLRPRPPAGHESPDPGS